MGGDSIAGWMLAWVCRSVCVCVSVSPPGHVVEQWMRIVRVSGECNILLISATDSDDRARARARMALITNKRHTTFN